MKTILVTGGSGFIGSSLVRALLARGHHVRVLDDNSRGNPRRLEGVLAELEMITADVRDADAVRRATRGVDVVAHLAYVNGTEFFYKKPDLVLDVGVKGALHTLDAAIAEGVSDYWLLSSSEVYQTPPMVPTDESVPLAVPDPENPRYSYGGGKIISELLALHYGHFERTIIVRPHNVYGPDMGWEHVIPQFALRAKDAVDAAPDGPVPFPIQGDGAQTRSFVYIDDFVDGCLRACFDGESGIYHVGTMDEVSIRELARAIVGFFGRETRIVAGAEPAGATQRRCPDIEKIARLGYAPRTSLSDGLRRTIPWYVENRHLRPGTA